MKLLLHFAFNYGHAKAVAVLEDDHLVGNDWIDYMEWLQKEMLWKPSTFGVCSHNIKSRREKHQDPYALFASGFSPRGWMISQKSWLSIQDDWTLFGNWDIHMGSRLMHRGGRDTRFYWPKVSRMKHIGWKGINYNYDSTQSVAWKQHDGATYVIDTKDTNYTGEKPVLLN